MLAVMSLSQHRVSSSKTIRPRAPRGAQCIGPRPPRETRPVHGFVTSLNVVLTRSSKTKRIVAFVQLSLLAHAHFGV